MNRILLVASVFWIISGMYVFLAGLHNNDLAWNVIRLADYAGVDHTKIMDRTLAGDSVNIIDGYIIGQRQILAGLLFTNIGSALFTVGLLYKSKN